MGKSLGYEFDDVHIKKGIYAPEGHLQIENENFLIRRGILRLLYGESSLQMDVKSFPYSEDAVKEQAALRKGIQDLVDGNRSLSVLVNKEKESS
jgi:hypothetical protein